jgi:sugar transferase (PEP-CTERM/EpsH1 system associated)
MSKPALVFLCQRLPFPPFKGERITSFNLLRYLTRHYRVFIGTFVDDPADMAGIDTVRGMVEELHVDMIHKPWAYLHAIPRWLRGEPVSFALFRSRRLSAWLDDVETKHQPVAIVTHSSNISSYAVDKFQRNGNAEPKRILHFADVDSEKFVAYAERAVGWKKWLFATEAERVRREERRLAAKADAVAFVSDEEAALFKNVVFGESIKVTTLPNGVDTNMFNPSIYPKAPFQNSGAAFIFTGAMDYLPNIEAVVWFAHQVFPGIRQVLPHAQFLIVGIKPSSEVQKLSTIPGVIVTGKVESVAAYLAHAQVTVAPLQIARGIQNKVLEAMAMALPVVASQGALTGINAEPGTHLICANTPEQWVQACIDLIQQPSQAYAMGMAAQGLVFTHYTWDAQFEKIKQLLNS